MATGIFRSPADDKTQGRGVTRTGNRPLSGIARVPRALVAYVSFARANERV